MAYTGRVEVGGAAETREAGDLVITKVAVGEMSNNAYLLRCALTGEQALIDAADEPETLLGLIGDGGGGAGPRAADGQSLARVVTTHWHPDHWQALQAVVDATGAETVAGEVDAEHIHVPTTNPVADGARVRVGSCELEVIHITGHTDGSIALAYDDPDGIVHLFTGDSLFPGGVGNTFGSKENFEKLIDDVETKLFGRFPDDTWFYPGHGNDSTLGAERSSLPQWRERGW